MATRHRTAVFISVYLAFFAISLGFFLKGHHVIALAIVLIVWAALSVWAYVGGAR